MIKENNRLFGIPTVLVKKLKRMIANHPAILAIDKQEDEGGFRGLQPCLFVQILATTKSSNPNPRNDSVEREVLSPQ